MPINEDLIQQLRYHWVKDFGTGIDNAVAAAAITPPSTTPTTESLPDTLSSSTVNNLSGGYHTHAVDATSDASTPAGYGKLLKAGASGTLGLRDLIVSNSVGIGMVPDPQFMLDVAGPVRAPYFVGKHAIQLDGALVISHFDGKERDLTGSADGHRGQAALISTGITFQVGRFSKAAAIGEATTNIHGNGDFEGGVTGWLGTGGGSIAHNGEKSWLNKFCGKATLPSGGTVYYPVTCTASTAYSYSAYVWSDVPATLTIGLSDFSVQALVSGSLAVPAKKWTRIQFSGTTNANTARYFTITNVGGSAATVYIDACQVEAKAYPTPYTPSSRGAGVVRYQAAGNIDRSIGTVMCWVNVGTGNANGYRRQVLRVDTTSGLLFIEADAANHWYIQWGTVATTIGTVVPNTWTHLAMTNDGAGTLAFYVNGALVVSNSTAAAISNASLFGGTLYIDVGQYSGDGSFSLNGMIDELAISDVAAPESLIKAIYESDAPVFAESSTFSFKIPRSTIWGNEDGLFVIDTNGNPVLGAIAATGGFSWGGQTLQGGDVLMGYGNNYLKWDRTLAKLLISAGDSKTIIDNNGITLVNGLTYDQRSALSIKNAGNIIADVYATTDTTSGSGYSLLYAESVPAAADTFGGVILQAYSRDLGGVLSPRTFLFLVSDIGGAKEDLYLDNVLVRSHNIYRHLILTPYGKEIIVHFGPNSTSYIHYTDGSGSSCRYEFSIKASNGLSASASGNIVSGGAVVTFSVGGTNDIGFTMPGGQLQFARQSGALTYQGILKILVCN